MGQSGGQDNLYNMVHHNIIRKIHNKLTYTHHKHCLTAILTSDFWLSLIFLLDLFKTTSYQCRTADKTSYVPSREVSGGAEMYW